MNNPMVTRPPIGFILEGRGEFESFPSLVNRILGVSNMNVPRSLAGGSGGYGRIVSDLPEEIRVFLRIHHPYALYICLDLIDVLKDEITSSCSELIELLTKEIDSFKKSHDPKCDPLPNCFGIVLQIPKFESWMIADLTSLVRSDFIDRGIDPIDNVDTTVDDPYQWLRSNLKDKRMDPKRPLVAKTILSSQDPTIMKTKSRSFDKFYREVTNSYESWKIACN